MDEKQVMKQSLEKLDPHELRDVFWWVFKDEAMDMLLECQPKDIGKAILANMKDKSHDDW